MLSEADLIFQDAGKTSTSARTVQLASIATDFATAGGTAPPGTTRTPNCVVSRLFKFSIHMSDLKL